MSTDPRGPVNSHDPFTDNYDHPMPNSTTHTHGSINVNANITPAERQFLEAGEEGGAD